MVQLNGDVRSRWIHGACGSAVTLWFDRCLGADAGAVVGSTGLDKFLPEGLDVEFRQTLQRQLHREVLGVRGDIS